MDNFLSQQIQQRSSAVGRLQDLITSNKNMFTEEWRENAQKDFQEGLDKYNTQLQNAVGKEIANKSEAVGILAGTPAFYSIGTGAYKNLLSKEGKESFDNIARNMAKNAEPAKKLVSEALGEAKEGLGKISQKANQMLGRASEKISDWTDVGDNALLQRESATAREQIMGDPENPLVTDPTMSAEEALGNVRSLPTATSNSQTAEAEAAGRSNLTENISAEAAGEIEGTTTAEAATLAGDVAPAVTSGLADEITAGLLAAAPEAGPGAVLLGGLAGLVGVGAGLATLFAHHTHKPKQFVEQNLSTPAIASRYDITKTILPSVSKTLGTGGTMQF
jgi:hypothetical protein